MSPICLLLGLRPATGFGIRTSRCKAEGGNLNVPSGEESSEIHNRRGSSARSLLDKTRLVSFAKIASASEGRLESRFACATSVTSDFTSNPMASAAREITLLCLPRVIHLGGTDISIWRAPNPGPNGAIAVISFGTHSFSLMARLRRG